MTFDEYWNDPDRARGSVGLYTHQIARAAYEAGARGAAAEVERLRAALRRLIQLGHAKDCTESRTEPCNCGQAEAVAALEDRKAP